MYSMIFRKEMRQQKMLYILMIAIIPLLVILGLYMNNPDSAFLKVIADRTGSLPAVLSAKNPLTPRNFKDHEAA